MKMTIKRRLNIGFTAGILLVLLVGAISFSTFQKQYTEAKQAKETYEVVNQLATIQNTLISMESGRRGFLSTSEKQFLQPYHQGLQHTRDYLGKLQNLLRNAPGQLQKANTASTEIEELFTSWKGAEYDTGQYSKAHINQLLGAEKVKMDRIQMTLSGIMQYENKLLAIRENESRKSINYSKAGLITGVLLILTTVILLIFQIIKEFENRQKAEASLKKNYKELAIINQKNAERNWLSSGLNKVNEILQAHLGSVVLSQEVLTTVIKYLDLKAGTFYIYDDERETLALTATFGLENSVKKEYALREGFAGQAAAEKELLVVPNIPAGYAIVEGTPQTEPLHAIYASLLHQNDLQGVIEILSVEPIKKSHKKFVKVVSNHIAVAVHSAKAREKVLQLLNTVQHQKEELDKVNKQLEKFVSMVSHDLKSPLAAIVTILSTLKRNKTIETHPDIREPIDMVSASSLHLAEMIDSILDYSRQSLSQQKMEMTDTHALVNQVVLLLSPPRHIVVKVSESLSAICTRKLKLQQVFQNLVSNAIKYNDKPAGLIEVNMTEKENFYEFSVRDNGPGIAKQDVNRVFKLFEVTNNKSNADSSTGMGLNLLKIIVEEQGGRIWVESALGIGSTFYFEWKKTPVRPSAGS